MGRPLSKEWYLHLRRQFKHLLLLLLLLLLLVNYAVSVFLSFLILSLMKYRIFVADFQRIRNKNCCCLEIPSGAVLHVLKINRIFGI